ncbi:MAG: alpha/beta hydrolase [Pelotomaculum sp.]|uniref:Hydrolases n=1 Tax=Pelotomaculum thermopropionicum (strain DSM 13744 / JCM 10971 / SI) TaxID=370438 RepID=A5D255_PELTS|nr:alpha/beta hydrolase [Pelotomaculum sp.]BAF59691.1 hydrolases [Pelotomaculum thermopropionicum SI]
MAGNSLKWEKVNYSNERGLKLAGLLCSVPGAGTVVIVCHGFTGSKEGGGRAVDMAEKLGKLGYASLLFDFSGCGESEGDFTGVSLTGHVGDIKSSVDFCLSLGFRRVITVGRSFGGTAAICHGGLDRRVGGVCTWAAPAFPAKLFDSFRNNTLKSEEGLVPLTGEGGTVFLKEGFFADLRSYNVPVSASMISPRPLLIINGSNDVVVPVENAQAIFNAAGEPKEIRIIEGADHQFTGRHKDVWEIMFKWLEKNFPA